jgi:hypothetical protein
MQNIEYKSNQSIGACIKDFRRLDGAIPKSVMKGMVPFFIARQTLNQTTEAINSEQSYWPLLMGALIAHPFYLIGIRTQAAPFARTQNLRDAQRNSMRTAFYLLKSKQLYRGFIPALAMYSLMVYPGIRMT